MRERFVIESGWQLNQIFWFGSKNTALPFLLSLPLQPANGEYPRTLPEYDNFYDDLMTIKTLYDDEKIAMMMLARWWRFFHSFPTDWSMQKKVSIFQSTISALWNWPKSNLEIARGGGGAETLRPLRQKYRNTVEKYEKYAQIPVSLVGFILK